MADNDQVVVEGDVNAQVAEVVATKPRRKLKVVIAVVVGLAIVVFSSAIWFLSSRNRPEDVRVDALPQLKPSAFVEVPDLVINLATPPGERPQLCRLRIVLEVRDDRQVEAIKPAMPRITDIFQTYLRELRPADLQGSAGMFRLKEELTRRVNGAVAPLQVSAVLFKEIVVQ